jgi:hypothetical protein
MNRKFATVGIILVMAAVGCGGADESGEPGTPYNGDEAGNAPQSFTVRLDRGTTAENVIPQIVAAARGQLAPMCEEHPGASVRIFAPLASNAYTDVPCSSALADDGANGEASAALVISESDGSIGQAQQKLGPISFLMCGLFAGGSTLFTTYVLCPRARTERDRANCGHVSAGGGFALGILCAIPF